MHSLDVLIRERALRAVKRLLGRELAEVRQTPRGIEVWMQSATGGLLVRKTNMRFLKMFLAQKGLVQIDRIAGQFTEGYTNMPTRALKRLLYALNVFYFRHIRSPNLALGNILFFRRTTD